MDDFSSVSFIVFLYRKLHYYVRIIARILWLRFVEITCTGVSVRLPGYRAINSQIFVTSWPCARKQDTRSTRCEIYTHTYRV